MATEKIPKLMFIDEWTEELLDKRLGPYQTFDKVESVENAEKDKVVSNFESRFVSEAPISPSLTNAFKKSTSIHNAIYVNTLGKMFVNTEQGIALYDHAEDIQPTIRQSVKKVKNTADNKT